MKIFGGKPKNPKRECFEKRNEKKKNNKTVQRIKKNRRCTTIWDQPNQIEK